MMVKKSKFLSNTQMHKYTINIKPLSPLLIFPNNIFEKMFFI